MRLVSFDRTILFAFAYVLTTIGVHGVLIFIRGRRAKSNTTQPSLGPYRTEPPQPPEVVHHSPLPPLVHAVLGLVLGWSLLNNGMMGMWVGLGSGFVYGWVQRLLSRMAWSTS